MDTWGEAPVIDLGLERDVPEVRPRPPGGGWAGLWSPVVRGWAFAGCLALVLLSAAGAAPPPQPSLSLVDYQPPAVVTGYTLVDDQLFILTGGARSGLSVYRARDGRLLWSTPVPGGWVGTLPLAGDLVLVVTQPSAGACCQIRAYGRVDGQVRWSIRGDPGYIDLDDDLIAVAVGASKQVMDVSSGRVRWQGDASAAVRVWGPHHLLLAYPDGTAEWRDLSTGETQASGRIHAPGDVLSATTIVDGQLIVGASADGQSGSVAAYDVQTLRLVWRRTGQLVSGASRCGPVLCLYTDRGLAAADPRTGAVRWRETGWYVWEQGGRLVAVTTGPGSPQGVGVVDPLTGRVLLDLRSWDVDLRARAETDLVLTRSSARGTTVALADLEELAVDVLGVMPGRVTDCQAGHGNLACRTAGGELQLWAYRR